jgi:hypothetical protein
MEPEGSLPASQEPAIGPLSSATWIQITPQTRFHSDPLKYYSPTNV